MSRSRKLPASMVERAKILLYHNEGLTTAIIASRLSVHRGKIERTVSKALYMGMDVALKDLPRSGRPGTITEEATAWLISLACLKPKELGYSYELWTMSLLRQHVRDHSEEVGYPSLRNIGTGTISKRLARHRLKPHKVTYYLELRDPNFDERMKEVVGVYREAQEARRNPDAFKNVVFISYDEKPGIQAIRNTAPDLPPVPGRFTCWGRDHEYERLGTMSLLAGLNLVTGAAHHLLADRHRSREFISFLQQLIASYPRGTKFRVILDNHSAHISKETLAYLATVPNRFEFIFTPKHASWLNLIEVFFSKMSRSMLREIRVQSKAELKQRIDRYFVEVNENPVPFTWKYMIEDKPAKRRRCARKQPAGKPAASPSKAHHAVAAPIATHRSKVREQYTAIHARCLATIRRVLGGARRRS